MNIIHTISVKIFDWVLSKEVSSYNSLYNVGSPAHYDGRDWGLIIMLLVALLAVLVYYFGVASNLKNATSANYLIVFGLSILTMLLLSCFLIPNLVVPRCPIEDIWDLNLLKFCLIDVAYYIVVYEVLSLFIMSLSRDKNRHLINTIF